MRLPPLVLVVRRFRMGEQEEEVEPPPLGDDEDEAVIRREEEESSVGEEGEDTVCGEKRGVGPTSSRACRRRPSRGIVSTRSGRASVTV